jgi:hypothetical protein
MFHREMKKLRQEAAAMAQEITSILDPLPESLQAAARTAAEEAFAKWRDFNGDDEIKKRAEQRSKLAERPQNKALAARASETGRLGGAPVGNQNARKHGLTSKVMPRLACDNCPHIQVCPQYRAGHVCAFTAEYEKELLTSPDESPEMTAVKAVLCEQLKRARRALLFETFEGGLLNKEASRVLRDVISAAQLVHQMKNPMPLFGNPPPQEGQKSQGVLDRIFGNLKPAEATVTSSSESKT